MIQKGNTISRLDSFLFCVLLTVGLAGCQRDSEPVIDLKTHDSLQFSAQPVSPNQQAVWTSQPESELELAMLKFRKDLQQLAEFANEVRTGENYPEIPQLFAAQFETTFIERNRLQKEFLDERIRIASWELSNQTPTYYETIALRRLFRTLLDPWRTATAFRIEFQLHSLEDRPNFYDAEIMVNISGNVNAQTIAATGASQEIGRSATGVWQIIWEKNADGTEPKIKQVDMLSHEEIINYIDQGVMFQDCTKSVLRNDQPLMDVLSYGLDQWAERIPGLDIIGDNGLSIGDVNNDALDDLYVCQPHGIGNQLLIQNPDGTADNKAAAAGVDFRDNSLAALIVDIDNDGRQDLVIATDEALVLMSSDGKGSFQLEHELKIGRGTQSLSAADFDQDGDLDLLLIKFRPVAEFDDIFAQPKNEMMNALNGGRNILLRNDEAWEFKDVTSDVGLAVNNQHYTRAAMWLDYDADGDQDLYFANYFNQDSLFENRNGWFREVAKKMLPGIVANNSSVSAGDFNRDGKSDFFVAADAGFTARRIAKQYIEGGGQKLKEAEGYSGQNQVLYFSDDEESLSNFEFQPPVFSSESSYGSVVADFNNDSWEDIAVTNGWLTRRDDRRAESFFYRHLLDSGDDENVATANPFQAQHEVSDLCRAGDSFNGFQRNRCFLSLGSLSFSNYSNSSGFDFDDDGRAVGSTDWDGDGNVDLVVTNRTAPRLRILHNRYRGTNGFLKLGLVGTKSNRDAIGSRVEVHLVGEKTPLVKMLTAGSGRGAQSSKEMHFGLGDSIGIEKVIIHWPDGSAQTFTELQSGKNYRIVEGENEAAERTNDRYRIAIDAGAIQPAMGTPDTDRIRFFPTTRLPILQYRSFGNPQKLKWYQIENVGRRPLFCIFCSIETDNTDLLRDWNSRGPDFTRLNADLLAVFHGNESDNDAHVKKSLLQVENADFKFPWGDLSEASNDKLSQLLGQWFFRQALPEEPFAILLDGDGNIHYAYDNGELSWETVAPDLENIANRNFALDQVTASAEENWLHRSRIPRFDRLQQRFTEIGYDRDAKVYADLAVRQDSQNFLNRAIDLASSGNLAEALTAAERSLELNPNSVEALIELAEISRQYSLTADQQARTRMLRTAGQLLDDALVLEPNNIDAILARAEIFRLQKDIENAIDLLIKYLQIDPECWRVHATVGRLFFHKRQDVEAARYLITAIENRPTLPYVAGDLGYLYLLNKEYGDAAEFLKLAIRLQPSDSDLKRHLAEAEFWQGNFESAGQLLEQTVTSQPTLPHPKKLLAWLKGCSPFASFRDGQAGLALIGPFVDPNIEPSPVVLEIQAVCYAENGNFGKAMESQQQALDLIENGRSLEKYSPNQLAALKDRLELFKRRKSYTMNDTRDVPINPPRRN